ncbi:hypothetical protein ABZP36_002306 [Zizania latifolia]
MEPTRCILRRPAASSSPLPPSSSSPPPPPPPSLPLPWALMPPKKRLLMLAPCEAATPPPAPVPAPAVETLAIPAPGPPPQVAEADRSTSAPPAEEEEEPSTAPSPLDDAAAKPAATPRVRKIIRKVIVKRIVPKGTFAARRAAAAAAAAGAALELRGETPTDRTPASDHNGAVGKEQNLDESVAEKLATDCNAVDVVEEILGFESATDCGDAHVGGEGVEMEEVGMSERQKRMTTEVFVGGLHRDAKEEDVRAVFAMVGDITEVRMIMDAVAGKNKGYCFVRYREPAQAKKAITEFANVKICGKLCRAAAPNGNDKNFLGNVDQKWTKEDVKSIFVEGVPTSWDQTKLTEIFKKHGKIGSVVLSRDMQSAKRNDFAFINYITHEAAISCLESFGKEELTENGSKVSIKVSLSKSVRKSKPIKEDHISCISGKGRMKIAQSQRKVGPSTTDYLLHVQREQVSRKHGYIGSVTNYVQDYPRIYSGEKRLFSALGDDSFYPTMRGHSHTHHESSTYIAATSSYAVLPHSTTISSPYYHDSNRYPPGLASSYGLTGLADSSQMRQASSRQLEQPYQNRHGKKY